MDEIINDSIHHTPFCGGAENACEIIQGFLDDNAELIEIARKYETFEKKKKERETLILKKQGYLNFLREEEDKVIVEIYILKNKSDNG
jgi:hypothetical protein